MGFWYGILRPHGRIHNFRTILGKTNPFKLSGVSNMVGKNQFLTVKRAVSVGANYYLEVLETSESSSLVTLYGLEVIRVVI